MLKVFIGYDSKEPSAFHVAAHSIMSRASRPVSIIPLMQPMLRKCGLYTRERGVTESTEFSLTRFLVPALCDYEGVAIFTDCDILVKTDIWELAAYPLAYPDKAVFVVKHDYTSAHTVKFLGQQNAHYPRKNWSSVMVFNTPACRALTPKYVNTASGLDLHRFNWLSDRDIGELPPVWNWLVGEYEPNPNAKLLHYTLGGPWFEAFRDCDHAEEWLREAAAISPVPLVTQQR
jgi:lipopolysaccharide biosynthesis glycosyltransferase